MDSGTLDALTQILAPLTVAAITYVAKVTRQTATEVATLQASLQARLAAIDSKLAGLAADIDRVAPRPTIGAGGGGGG